MEEKELQEEDQLPGTWLLSVQGSKGVVVCTRSHALRNAGPGGWGSGQASLEQLAPHLRTMHECVRPGARTTQRPQSVAQRWGAYKGDKAMTLQPTQGLDCQLYGPSLWHWTDQNLNPGSTTS